MSQLQIVGKEGKWKDEVHTDGWQPRQEVIQLFDYTTKLPQPVFFYYLWKREEDSIKYSVKDGILEVNEKVVGADLSKVNPQKLATRKEIESIVIKGDTWLSELKTFPDVIAIYALNETLDTDLNQIGTFKELRVLDLRATNIHDEGVKALEKLHGLWRLYLPSFSIPEKRIEEVTVPGSANETTSMEITDTGILALNELRELRLLRVRGKKISDDSLRIVSTLPLRELDISYTGVTDTGLTFLHSCTTLKMLCLGNTAITDKGIARLKEVLPDCWITTDCEIR